MRGSSRLSALLQLLLLPFPWQIRRSLLNALFGFEINQGAWVGFSLLLADRVTLAEGARIRHLTLIKKLAHLNMGRYSGIGPLNWINGLIATDVPYFRDEPNRVSILEVEEYATITTRHYLDCTNRVRIGAFSTLAGVRSQILTHSIDVKASKQSSAPVSIGRHCFVGTGVILLKGSSLPDYCILAAGSVLRHVHAEEYCLLSGVPAEKVRDADRSWKYFHRTDRIVE